MILLFTSSNDKYPLYKRDLLNVCCEPSTAGVQFAYRNKRIPAELLDGEGMKGQDVLVVFCESVSTEAPFYNYHPLRLGKIITQPETEYQSLNITFQLREFFDYRRYETDAQFIKKFQAYILRDDKHPGGNPYSWVREDEDLLPTDSQTPEPWRPTLDDFADDGWIALIEHLREREGLKDCTFFSVQKGDTFGGPPVFLFDRTPEYKAGRARYKLRSGISRRVSLYIPFVEQSTFPNPELKVDANVGTVTGPFLRQRSSGVEADFEVRLKRSFQEERTMLELRLPAEPSLPARVTAPQFQALVIAQVAWGFLAAAIFLLVVGGILAVISPSLLDEIAKGTFGNTRFGVLLDANKQLAFVITKMLSFLALAGGTFLGFNKLPLGK